MERFDLRTKAREAVRDQRSFPLDRVQQTHAIHGICECAGFAKVARFVDGQTAYEAIIRVSSAFRRPRKSSMKGDEYEPHFPFTAAK